MTRHEIWTDAELDEALSALRRSENDTDHADDGALAAGRTALLTAAAAPAVVRALPQPSRRWSGRRLVAAAAAVGVLAAGGMVATTLQVGGGPALNTAVAATLDDAAIDALGAADEPVGPGQYRYVRTRAWWMSGYAGNGADVSYLAEHVHETWAPADERDEWLERRDVTGARQWVVGTEEEARAAGIDLSPADVEDGEYRAPCGDFFAADEGAAACDDVAGSWQQPTRAWQDGLPTDPQELYERLRADAPDSADGNDRGDIELLVYAADALRSGLVDADVRAAIYRALAYVPSLQVVDTAANLDGRVGTALGIDDGAERQEIIIDPATGQFIGERTVTTSEEYGVPVGTAVDYSSVTTGVVDEMGARPAG